MTPSMAKVWMFSYMASRRLQAKPEEALASNRPPISLTGTFVQIDWGFDNGLCHEVPDSRVPLTPPQQVRLIPYGCTNLRMTEMPWIQAESPT